MKSGRLIHTVFYYTATDLTCLSVINEEQSLLIISSEKKVLEHFAAALFFGGEFALLRRW